MKEPKTSCRKHDGVPGWPALVEMTIYRHYKGDFYQALTSTIRRESDMVPMVAYWPVNIIHPGNLGEGYLRTEEEFFGTVEVDGVECRRFAPLNQDEIIRLRDAEIDHVYSVDSDDLPEVTP